MCTQLLSAHLISARMAQQGSLALKENNPDLYEGWRDFFVVIMRLNKVEQCLAIPEISETVTLTDASRIVCASKFRSGTAAV